MVDQDTIAQLGRQVTTLTRIMLLQSSLLFIVFARVLFGENASMLAFGVAFLGIVVWGFIWMIRDSSKPMRPASDPLRDR